MSSSGVANSPAITTITNDWIDKMLSGSDRTNEAVAGVVAGLYFLFLLLSLFNFIRDKKRLQFLLILFCAIRIVAFSVRAYMQKHLSENLAIVYEVFFAVGFVFLVKLLLTLLSCWTMPLGVAPKKRGLFFSLGLLRNQGIGFERLITISLMVGAVCSIIGATDAYSDNATVNEYNKGLRLMKAGYTIYLACITMFVVMVITGPILNRMAFGPPKSVKSATVLVLGLLAAGLLLMCKSVFQVIAIYTNPSLTYNSKLFYPLEVLPELLVLCIVCFPGFIAHMLRGSHAYPETEIKAQKSPTVGSSTPTGTVGGAGSPRTPTEPTTATPVHTHDLPPVRRTTDAGIDNV